MNWARTLMLADMLTKAIQANVAREAHGAINRAPPSDKANDKPREKESTMTDQDVTDTPTPAPVIVDAGATPDAPLPATPTAENTTGQTVATDAQAASGAASGTTSGAAAHVATLTPAASGALPQEADVIATRLIHAANLVKTLSEKPEMIEILKLLMGQPKTTAKSDSATA